MLAGTVATAYTSDNMSSETPNFHPLDPAYEQHRVNLKREAETEFGLIERGEQTFAYYDIEDIIAALRRARATGQPPETT